MKAWIGRKVADATRHLTVPVCGQVDIEITPYADRISWTRLDAIIAATWMRTDPEAAEQADQAARESLGAWVSGSTEQGTKTVFVRAEAPDVIRFDGTLDRVADSLGILGDPRSKDQRRAAALGWLANPQATLDLFDQAADQPPASPSKPHRPRPSRHHGRPTRGRRPPSTSTSPTRPSLARQPRHRHGGVGVARVEGIGPVTLNRLQDLAVHSRVTVKPVIDLTNQTPVDGYEIPTRVREAIHLICSGRLLPLRHLDQPHRRPRPHHPLPHPTTVVHPAKPGSGTSDRSPAATTAPKPSAAGPSTRSGPACSSGDHPTATTTWSTTPAPAAPNPGPPPPEPPGSKWSKPAAFRRGPWWPRTPTL